MTERNGKYHPPTTLVTPRMIYQAAVLQGVLSNTEIIHDPEKTTSLAQRYATRMLERDEEQGFSR